MKKQRVREQFLEGLTETPNITIVCKRLNISRNAIYNWRHEDEAFCLEMDLALYKGDDHFNDVSESKLMEKIKDGNLKAIMFRLEKCSSKYSKHKLDDIIMADARERKHKKDWDLWEKATTEARIEKFKTSAKGHMIVKPHTLEKMLSMGLIDWAQYNSSLKHNEEMEKIGVTSQDEANILLEKMEPTTEEILGKYEKRKKEIKDQIFPNKF